MIRAMRLLLAVIGVSAGLGCGDSSANAAGGEDGGGAAGGGSSDGSSTTATGASSSASGTGTGGSQGGDGIASKYPGDVGIENDPDVILADDFESYASAGELGNRWDQVYGGPDVSISTDPAHVFAGAKAVEFFVPQQDGEYGVSTVKLLSEGLDVIHLRYYSKFQGPFDVIGSSHNGSTVSAHYFVDGQASPGVPADGYNKFLVALENWRGEAATPSPGDLNAYVYHPEQRSEWGDHFFPTGFVMPYSPEPFDFGPDFVSHPDIVPGLDEYHSYEYRVQANTPGQRDGRITVWFDGELAADFGNLRLRDTDALRIDHFMINFHIHGNPNGPARKWYDNFVAAKSYIGPVH
jgi:hypothetical protein